MEQVLTVVCKLEATPEQMAKLEATCVAFADACTYTTTLLLLERRSNTKPRKAQGLPAVGRDRS